MKRGRGPCTEAGRQRKRQTRQDRKVHVKSSRRGVRHIRQAGRHAGRAGVRQERCGEQSRAGLQDRAGHMGREGQAVGYPLSAPPAASYLAARTLCLRPSPPPPSAIAPAAGAWRKGEAQQGCLVRMRRGRRAGPNALLHSKQLWRMPRRIASCTCMWVDDCAAMQR